MAEDEHVLTDEDTFLVRQVVFFAMLWLTFIWFDDTQAYLNHGLWWIVLLVEGFIGLKVVTGYPKYGSVLEVVIMYPIWMCFHIFYIWIACLFITSLAFIGTSLLFGTIGIILSVVFFLLSEIPLLLLQGGSFRK